MLSSLPFVHPLITTLVLFMAWNLLCLWTRKRLGIEDEGFFFGVGIPLVGLGIYYAKHQYMPELGWLFGGSGALIMVCAGASMVGHIRSFRLAKKLTETHDVEPAHQCDLPEQSHLDTGIVVQDNTARVVQLSNLQDLPPVRVTLLEDMDTRVILECDGQAWSAQLPDVGDSDVAGFVANSPEEALIDAFEPTPVTHEDAKRLAHIIEVARAGLRQIDRETTKRKPVCETNLAPIEAFALA